MYHEGNRELQERFDTRGLADRVENLQVHDTFTDRDKGFVESRDMVLPRHGRRAWQAERQLPVPSWKRSSWAVDVLPEGDPALDPDATVV